MIEKITSNQNPKIKNILKLQKSSERKGQNLFVIEGYREINLAVNAGYQLTQLFYCPELLKTNKLPLSQFTFEISRPVFEKVAYRESSDGIIAIAKVKSSNLTDIHLSDNPLIIVLESVEKPGNLGAVLRTADAANVDAVIICDPQTDIFNPNVIRSSVGGLFTNQVVTCTNKEAFMWFKEKKIKTYATALTATKSYYEAPLTKPVAIIMGTEATGLSNFWLTHADEQIIIPMHGKIDSLNISNATAIITFEAKRQRLELKKLTPKRI